MLETGESSRTELPVRRLTLYTRSHPLQTPAVRVFNGLPDTDALESRCKAGLPAYTGLLLDAPQGPDCVCMATQQRLSVPVLEWIDPGLPVGISFCVTNLSDRIAKVKIHTSLLFISRGTCRTLAPYF